MNKWRGGEEKKKKKKRGKIKKEKKKRNALPYKVGGLPVKHTHILF